MVNTSNRPRRDSVDEICLTWGRWQTLIRRFLERVLASRPSSEPRGHVPRPNIRPHHSGNLQNLLTAVQETIGESDDIVIRRFIIAGESPAALIYVESMVERKVITEDILQPLVHEARRSPNELPLQEIREKIDKLTVTVSEVDRVDQFDRMVEAVLNGDTVLAIDGVKSVWALETKGFKHRNVEPPSVERSVRGSNEGFTEPIDVNLSLIRRRLKDPNLRIKNHTIGERTKTRVAVLFIEGLTNKEIVKAAEERLTAIDVDGVLESATIEQHLNDHPYSIFPLTRVTPRPDLCVKWLLTGRVIIVVDNTPFAITVPVVLQDFYKTIEDITHAFFNATIIHWVRLAAALIAPQLPGLYIALTAVHPEMIPTELAMSIAGSREGLPFPTIVEVIMMEITMEILREAAIRMPSQMGATIGIVGGLVIGTAAAQAGIISNLMVIIVSLTAIATFAPPSFEISIPTRLMRWGFAMSAAFLGLYGMGIFALVIIGHLCSLSSFGVPYLTPYSPVRGTSLLKNSLLLTWPGPLIKTRPSWLRPQDRRSKGSYEQPTKGPQLDDED